MQVLRNKMHFSPRHLINTPVKTCEPRRGDSILDRTTMGNYLPPTTNKHSFCHAARREGKMRVGLFFSLPQPPSKGGQGLVVKM